MADSPDSSGSSSASPWRLNPFATGTQAHKLWADATAIVREEVTLAGAEILGKMPPENASDQDFLVFLGNAAASTFDGWAGGFLKSAAPRDDAADGFEGLCEELEKAVIREMTKRPISFIPSQVLMTEVRRRIIQRKLYWVAEMLKKVREHKENRNLSPAGGSEPRPVDHPRGDDSFTAHPESSIAEKDERNRRLYNEKLAHKILKTLAGVFPNKLHLSQLQELLPDEKSLPPEEWRAAIEALMLERKMDGQIVSGILPFDFDAAALYATDIGRSQLRTQQPSPAGSPYHEIPDSPELPGKFQDQFEAAKSKADLQWIADANTIAMVPQMAAFRDAARIHRVFFAYCDGARSACREGRWTAKQVRQSVDAAWISICDSYVVLANPSASQESRLELRRALRLTMTNDQRWKQHLTDVVELAEGSPADSARGAEGAVVKIATAAGAESGATPHIDTVDLKTESPGVVPVAATPVDPDNLEAERKRQRTDADMNAVYRRFLSRNPSEAAQQEELIRDAREYVAMSLTDTIGGLTISDDASDEVLEQIRDRIRNQVALKTWDDFRPGNKNFPACQLDLREFDKAVWSEGYPRAGDPSLDELLTEAIWERAGRQIEGSAVAGLDEAAWDTADEPLQSPPPTAIGRNISRLRKECGWSFDELAKKTGLGKKLILGHVKGKGLHPKTLKIYADAFTKGLGRTVTVAEIES